MVSPSTTLVTYAVALVDASLSTIMRASVWIGVGITDVLFCRGGKIFPPLKTATIITSNNPPAEYFAGRRKPKSDNDFFVMSSIYSTMYI